MELRAIGAQVKSTWDGNPIQNMYLKGKNRQGEKIKKCSHLKKGFPDKGAKTGNLVFRSVGIMK